MQGLTYHTPVSSVAVYGGVPMEPQERALKAGVDIVVATPGRLMDHMRHDVGDFSKLEDPRARRSRPHARHGLLARRPARSPSAAAADARQTLLFSATMPDEVLKLTQEFLRDPKYVQVGRARRAGADDLARRCRPCRRARRPQWLARWLRDEADGPGARVRAAPRSAPIGWPSS